MASKRVVIPLVLVLALTACAQTGPFVLPTSLPPEVATRVVQAPTLGAQAAATAAAAAQAAATAAARLGGTSVPSVETAAASAAGKAAPVVQTAAAAVKTEVVTAVPAVETGAASAQTLVGTAIPFVQTQAAAAQTSLATPLLPLPGPATPTAGNRVVQVKLSEFKIDMPTSLPAGTVTFQITNAGTIQHSFEIKGQSLDAKLDAPLNPGAGQTLRTNLAPGNYTVFCPLDGHKDQGMLVNLTVTP